MRIEISIISSITTVVIKDRDEMYFSKIIKNLSKQK